MLNVSVSAFAKPVVHQRRFRYLLAGLMVLSIVLGLVVVPLEKNHPQTRFQNWHDGIWWSAITVTGVGYGDIVPVTPLGRFLGLILAAVGVLSFSLVVSMFGMALAETKDRYYRLKLFEQLDDIQKRLDRLEKSDTYILKKEVEMIKATRQRDDETTSLE